MPSFMTLSVGSLLIYQIQITAETAFMTLVFLRTNGSVLLAVLAHLTFNTAESVVFGGLPASSVERLRAVYLVNVAVLALLGLVSLLLVSQHGGRNPAPQPSSRPCPWPTSRSSTCGWERSSPSRTCRSRRSS